MTTQIKTFALLALLSGLIVFLGGVFGGQTGMIIALGLAIIMNISSYWFSASIVLKMYNARVLDRNDSPALHDMVEELANRANIPKPTICIIPDQSPNAFATGRNPENGVVAVTEGIVKLLNRAELRGVIAHEIAHIAHRDILIQTVASILGAAITSIAQFMQFGMLFGSRDSQSNNNALVGLVLAILAPIAASLIQMALSRTREYHADAGGASFANDPLALASALDKISNYSQQVPMENANPATENMFIISPLTSKDFASLFSTHPPTNERIARLQQMAAHKR